MNRIDPRRVTAACTCIALALALGACASSTNNTTNNNLPTTAARAASGHAGCFDPRSVRGFAPIADDVLLVDAGSRYYRVQLDGSCFGADSAPAMQFRGDPISGRVCGRFGESVSWSHHECQIQRVDWITKEEHDALLNPPKADGTPTSGR